MQKKKWEILNIIKQEIFNNIKSYVIVTIIFTVGLFLGVLFINQTESKDNISQYINTYPRGLFPLVFDYRLKHN